MPPESIFDKFTKYHKKILLGGFKAKVSREVTSKPKIGNESLHEISNDNGVGVANIATSKHMIVKSQCPHIITFINLLEHLLMERLAIKFTTF
jgi:hypothetical protein